ncbi:response regulator [soil metagenome]
MATENDTHDRTILVVDDNDANRALAKNALEDEGYRVVLASGGAAAIEEFEKEKPDCILLDVRMPEMDGFAVCERIRNLPRGADTPVIFLTALRDVDTFDRAVIAGGDDFLTKPVRPSELVARVRTALKLRWLRTELHEHYDALKRQRDDLLRLQLQKERLMAFVVHDLKNPVSSMDLHAQLVLRDKTLSESVRSSVMQIRTDAQKLNQMIMNLLDVSKGDEGKLIAQRSDVVVAALVAEVMDELEISANARKVKLASEVGVETARVDRDLVRRALTNLVENAIRHAPAGSTVTSSVVTVTVSGAAELSIRVTDRGTGVPETMREAFFDPFVQLGADALPSSRRGRGLGLAFCRLVDEAHGGRIWIEDAAPGAVFCVSLR